VIAGRYAGLNRSLRAAEASRIGPSADVIDRGRHVSLPRTGRIAHVMHTAHGAHLASVV